MNVREILKAYHVIAPIYWFVFGFSLEPARRRMMKQMAAKKGENVLEIGAGTGMTLRHYAQGVKITGIDLSADMLAVAQGRVLRSGRENVNLMLMNAQDLKFADNSFDKVIALFVATVVEDPQKMVREMRRVCKPGGDIWIVNHFSRKGTFLRFIERVLEPFAPMFGFNPLFDLDEFLKKNGLEDATLRPAQAWGYWQMIHQVKPKKRSLSKKKPK